MPISGGSQNVLKVGAGAKNIVSASNIDKGTVSLDKICLKKK
jgi:hypothetical protein